MLNDYHDSALIAAVLSLFSCIGYVAYSRSRGTVMASQTIWSQEITDAKDFLMNTFALGKRVEGQGFEKELATQPLYLRADQGELEFEMQILCSGLETNVRGSTGSAFENKISFAGFALMQAKDNRKIFNIPPTTFTPTSSTPAGLLQRRYIYKVTRGKLLDSGAYIFKASLPYDLLGRVGTQIDLRVISGRPPLNLRIIGGLLLVFVVSIITLIFITAPQH